MSSYDLYVCPECNRHGISGVTGGVGPWPGDGKVRCPSQKCGYATVMERRGRLVFEEDAHDADIASMQAAFWRARAIELGADADEWTRRDPGGADAEVECRA